MQALTPTGPLSSTTTAAAASTTTTAVAAARCSVRSPTSSSSSLKLTRPITTLISRRTAKLSHFSPRSRNRRPIFAGRSNGGVDSGPTTTTAKNTHRSSSGFDDNDAVLVGADRVPLEGVIQFEKGSSSSRIDKWGRIALLAGGDVLALLLFAAIGRFSHGFVVFDAETLRTADPFIAGWFMSAYFLGGYGEEGRGMKGFTKALVAAAKSWALGVPLGLGIRAVTSGHLPPTNFMVVTMGSTAVLLMGCRAILLKILPNDDSKKDDVYRRGSPFELFELLTSLVRRW